MQALNGSSHCSSLAVRRVCVVVLSDRPNRLVPGAVTFHEFLVSTDKQFVYLSNTGAKASDAVRKKLRSSRYCLSAEKLPPNCVFTAAEAQADFMAERIPEGAKVFVVSGGGPFWLELLRKRCPALLDSWEVRARAEPKGAKFALRRDALHLLRLLCLSRMLPNLCFNS